nr:MBL fold metallo-hydrolase RNA specificity domain-containing protein [Pseudomonas sp. EggHat1]
MRYPSIVHDGAISGVTGSCHQLQMGDEHALLIDCGLFQGADTSSAGRAGAGSLAPDFSLDGKALVATHAHVGRVGRIAYLLQSGFNGSIFCSESSARLLPIVLEGAFKLGSSRDRKHIGRDLKLTELRIVALTQTAQPAIVIAAGNGMCSSGRIVNQLKTMQGGERHDVLFVGCQAGGAPGRQIQHFGPRSGYLEFDGQRYDIRAQVHTIGGYSARADQKGLVSFVTRMMHWPSELRVVHGELDAKQQFTTVL